MNTTHITVITIEELTDMNTLAHAWGDGEGPGPWVLLFPLVWAAAVAGVITVLRRAGWRGRGRGRGPWAVGTAEQSERSPLAVLGRRFAAGEIDEEEYWRRLSVLEEHFGRQGKGGAA